MVVGASSLLHVAAVRLAIETHAPSASFLSGATGDLNPGLHEPLQPLTHAPILETAECRWHLSDLIDLFDWTPGFADLAFLSGLQVDRFGNVNTIAIGPHERPTLRGPGAVGASALAAFVDQVHLVVERHDTRALVERVDYVSAFGWKRDDLSREDLGLKTAGPVAIHTPLAQFDFTGGEAFLAAVQSGEDISYVRRSTGFATASCSARIAELREPESELIHVLRRCVDTNGLLRESP